MSRFSSRSIFGIAAVAAVALLVTPMTASAATSMLIRGTVTCSGSQPAVGVWIESSAGGSEWANDQSWLFSTASPNKSYRYFEETVSSRSSKSTISLHVGCGGTPSKWTKDLWSKGFPVGSAGRVINVACDYSKPSRKTGACTEAPVGRDAKVNPYNETSDYCTGGAVYQWYKATGYWPYLSRRSDGSGSGDARYMDDNAVSNRFRVSTVPHLRSIVVFNNATPPFGHVGWVTRIYRVSGRIYFDMIDRNGGRLINASQGITDAFGKDVLRKGKLWDSSQRFIVARAYPR